MRTAPLPNRATIIWGLVEFACLMTVVMAVGSFTDQRTVLWMIGAWVFRGLWDLVWIGPRDKARGKS